MKSSAAARSNMSVLIFCVGLVALVISLLTLCGRCWWFLDVLGSFTPHFALIFSAWALVEATSLRWKAAALFAVVAGIHLYPMLPYWFARTTPVDVGGSSLRVLAFNVYSRNTNRQEVEAYLREEDADIILLTEITAEWVSALEDFGKEFSCTIWHPKILHHGIALLSKLPCLHHEIVIYGELQPPVIDAVLSTGTREIRMIGIHTVPPSTEWAHGQRNRQLRAMAEVLAAESRPKIAIGDLNLTPWSYLFREISELSATTDSARGFGIQTTWSSELPLLVVPIDHILFSDDFKVEQRRIGPSLGSDHFAVIADVRL